MLNIIVPLAGSSDFFKNSEFLFPKPLIEVNGRSLIEYVVDNFKCINTETKFTFIVREEDCIKFHLDNTLRLLSHNCEIIQLKSETKGAVCSVLMAIEQINNNDPVIIVNGDQIIDIDYNNVINKFESEDYDAGIITFKSVHPRWSFASINADDLVVETAEKNPISSNAIAGFYYYKKGKDFIQSSFDSILKDANINGLYYISSTLNEMILINKTVGVFEIRADQYHSFYSPQKIKEFEKFIVD